MIFGRLPAKGSPGAAWQNQPKNNITKMSNRVTAFSICMQAREQKMLDVV